MSESGPAPRGEGDHKSCSDQAASTPSQAAGQPPCRDASTDERGDVNERDAGAVVGLSGRLWGVFLLIALAGVTLDLWSKHAVFAWLGGHEPDIIGRITQPIIPGVLHFTLSTNPGVVFGFDRIPRPAVVAASFAAFALVGWFFACSPRRARWTHLALAMILGGAAGNLYDRLFSRVDLPALAEPVLRQVRDFIDFSPLRIGSLNYPWIFNVADVLLVVGVGILLVISLFGQRQTPEGDPDEKA